MTVRVRKRRTLQSPFRAIGRLIGPLAVVVGLALVAGCGAAGSTDQASGPTRGVTDANGARVQVPADPKGVLALGENDLDAALALGAPVVGTLKGRGQDGPPSYLAEQASGIPTVGELTKPDADAITKMIVDGKADLILVSGLSDAKVVDGLREMGAPVVVTATAQEQDWKRSFDRVAEAVGKQDKARQVRADYDAKVAEVTEAIGPHAGDTVSVVRWNAKGPGPLEKDRFASLVIAETGLSRPPAQQQVTGQGGNTTLSLEQLDKIDADWLFVGSLSQPDRQAFEEAKSLPQYQALGAVQRGHVIGVDGTKWTSRGGPIAANGVLDDLRAAMAS